MWDSVVDIIISSVASAFEWFGILVDSIPGSWNTIFTIFVILVICRFLLGPLLGVAFSGSSDKARIEEMKHENKLRKKAKEK